MRDYVGERADWLGGPDARRPGRRRDRPALSPDALAHFCLLLAMGSALVTPDLHAVDDEEWAALLGRVVTAFAQPVRPQQATGQDQCRTGPVQ